MSKNPLPNVDQKLLSDIKCYEDIVRQYKFKQMEAGFKGNDLIETVDICINDILSIVRATLVEECVNEADIKMYIGIYEYNLCSVRDDKTPLPKNPVNDDEKSSGVMETIKEYVVPSLAGTAAIFGIVKGVVYVAKAIKGSPRTVQLNDDLDEEVEVIGQDEQ